MGWLKIVGWLVLIGLIVGAFIGIAFLIIFAFASIFMWFTLMMVEIGADPGIAPIVALILTVFIFYSITRNSTVNNYIYEKTSKWSEKKENSQ